MVNSKASINLSGAVQAANGSAFAAQEVMLIRHPDLLQGVVEAAATVATLGLACLSNTDSICHPLSTAQTALDGSFAFAPLKGSDTQGSAGNALLFSTFVAGPAANGNQISAAAVTTDFYLQHVTVILPTARLWLPALAQTTAASTVSLGWPSLQQGIGQPAQDYALQVIGSDGATVWSQSTSTPNLQLDPRATEDFGGTWTVTANRTVAGTDTSFGFHYLAPAKAYGSSGRVPLSRHATCAVQSLSGSQALSPCPLTDGDLTTFFAPLTCPQGSTCAPGAQNNWISMDLGAPQGLSALVLHALTLPNSSVSLLVDYSNDGSTWLPLATPASSPYQLTKITAGVSARYVRLRLSDSTTEFTAGVNEVAFY